MGAYVYNPGKTGRAKDVKVGQKKLFGYDGDTVESGSAAERRHIGKLTEDIEQGQYDFMTYYRDMERVLNPTDAQQEIDAANQDFCRYMLNICLDPLSHGANKDAVLECVGMYIGMSLFSSDFRRTVKAEVGQSLLPKMEKRIERKAKVADFADRYKQYAAAAVESVTGKQFEAFDRLLSPDYVSNQQRADEKIQRLRDQVGAAQNQGRIPLTPESAATQYLNFGVSAYNAMRKPGADKALIAENYEKSIEALTKMAAKDGIPEEQLQRNVLAVYGKVASKHPEIARCFEETSYGDAVRLEGETVEGEDGTRKQVWRGEFDPSKWKGSFTPRAVRNPTEHREKMAGFMADMGRDVDSFKGLCDVLDSKEFEDVSYYWTAMMQEDVPNCDPEGWDKERDDPYAVTKKGQPKIMSDVVTDFGHTWFENLQKQGKTPTDYDEFIKWATKQQAHRDASDIPDYGTESGSEPQY